MALIRFPYVVGPPDRDTEKSGPCVSLGTATIRTRTDCPNPQKHLGPGTVCPLPPVTPPALGRPILGRRLFRAFRRGCRDGGNHSSVYPVPEKPSKCATEFV